MNRFLWLFTDVGCAVVIIVFACVFATTAALSQAVTDIHMQFSMPDDAAFATADGLYKSLWRNLLGLWLRFPLHIGAGDFS